MVRISMQSWLGSCRKDSRMVKTSEIPKVVYRMLRFHNSTSIRRTSTIYDIYDKYNMYSRRMPNEGFSR